MCPMSFMLPSALYLFRKNPHLVLMRLLRATVFSTAVFHHASYLRLNGTEAFTSQAIVSHFRSRAVVSGGNTYNFPFSPKAASDGDQDIGSGEEYPLSFQSGQKKKFRNGKNEGGVSGKSWRRSPSNHNSQKNASNGIGGGSGNSRRRLKPSFLKNDKAELPQKSSNINKTVGGRGKKKKRHCTTTISNRQRVALAGRERRGHRKFERASTRSAGCFETSR
mmetsp:Transcript_35346/g.81940  ORF Transcript_35346/g.81940 Transcript_35346/m.81940 type:complete len:221 (-) Transcript_35346:2471-3133(-)